MVNIANVVVLWVIERLFYIQERGYLFYRRNVYEDLLQPFDEVIDD